MAISKAVQKALAKIDYRDLASGATINLANRKIVHKELHPTVAKVENFFKKSSELKWVDLENPEENWTAVIIKISTRIQIFLD